MWRYYGRQFLLTYVGLGCALALFGYFTQASINRLLFGYLVVSAVHVCLVYLRAQEVLPSLRIALSSAGVSGPAEKPRYDRGLGSWTPVRVAIPPNALDRRRSMERSTIDRCMGRQYLYSTDGDVIFFARYAFRRSDVKQLLAQLQLN